MVIKNLTNIFKKINYRFPKTKDINLKINPDCQIFKADKNWSYCLKQNKLVM